MKHNVNTKLKFNNQVVLLKSGGELKAIWFKICKTEQNDDLPTQSRGLQINIISNRISFITYRLQTKHFLRIGTLSENHKRETDAFKVGSEWEQSKNHAVRQYAQHKTLFFCDINVAENCLH